MATAPTKKELLLKAAKELFSEHGYSETTFKKISERAGVALGLLTHHFGNKEKFFLTAGLDVVQELVQTMRTNLQGVPNGLEAVRTFAKTYFDFARNPRQDFMVLVRCSPFSDLKTTEDKAVMIRNFSELYDILRECVELGVKDGSIRKVDPQKTSVVVFCNLVGGIRHGLLTPYGDDTPLRRHRRVRHLRPQETLIGRLAAHALKGIVTGDSRTLAGRRPSRPAPTCVRQRS